MKNFIITFILFSIIPVAVLKSMDAKSNIYNNSPVTENEGRNNTIATSRLMENELFWQMDKRTNQLGLYIQQKGKPVLLEVRDKKVSNVNLTNIPDHPKQIINMN